MDKRPGAFYVTGAVALFAAADSYTHIYALARESGQTVLSGALLPLSVDGIILAASMNLLKPDCSRKVLSEIMLILGVAATVLANVLYGLPHGARGAVISAWPAVAFLCCAEVAIGMTKRPAKPQVAVKNDVPRVLTRVQANPGGGTAGQALRKTPVRRDVLVEFAGEPEPSINEIRRRMKCGQIVGRQLLSELQSARALAAA